ncbi:CDP-glycerol glycerophosphotransferase family protein [Devosia sp. ZB163]|uniref:CDP-glycerol glycerophosphotransferase family protein n=1 Tax=Devosia sp. ZB163 TaxID=3025938 RepID=UPI00236074C0|nr:CDP-glycerol glycerophosphotransferase family protein [Devosia sp. ZB163]MDC9826320.1 CDP-glycerol glycerophosphotransferase family protein [Devosia sp. ZB163]
MHRNPTAQLALVILKKIPRVSIELLLNALVRPAIALLPRNPRLWVFGSSLSDFEGNAKYLFLWMRQNHPEISCVWIARSRQAAAWLRGFGYDAEFRYSLRGMWMAIRGGAAFVTSYSSDINTWATGGAKLINLWHGVSLKRIGYDSKKGVRSTILKNANNPLMRLAYLHRFILPDLFLSTSEDMTRRYVSGFQLPADRIIETGHPRQQGSVDRLLRDEAGRTGRSASIDQIIDQGRRVLVYMPTWRDSDRPFIGQALPDLRRLDAALERVGSTLFVSFHSNSSENFDVSTLANVRLWPKNADFYYYKDEIDGIITDYSSSLYDYVARRDSGVVLYDFDRDEYLSKDRELIFPYEENVVGRRASTFDELCTAIESGSAFSRLDAERLAMIRRRFWGESRDDGCEQIFHRVLGLLRLER